MLKMARKSIETSESVNFYKYLCQQIGSEEVVRIRRLAYVISDIGQISKTITSGSIGEGLDLEGSDLDVMWMDNCFKVYESETEVKDPDSGIPLIMYTGETQPCFTQLCYLSRENIIYKNVPMTIPDMFQKTHLRYVLSSELYKLDVLTNQTVSLIAKNFHGPCISYLDDTFDLARCIKCDKWISQANPWNLYGQGIDCFASTETLKDYQSQSDTITESLISRNVRFSKKLMITFDIIRSHGRIDRFSRLLYGFLHHSRTDLSRSLFALQLSAAFMIAPEATKEHYKPGNKHHYLSYKRDLSHLMIGLQSDAVSGLLKLASFFYAQKNFFASLTVISYILQKYTAEKIYTRAFHL
ncbi:unnamed protein product [Mytilus coruscus]|uniref:Mab-21-like HhH/H2TH-like domain-containing protein n=1 Tax=Mytilus coruscus TaxID=42192 RepID=A0A6J8AS14_MYTCO|nr:unnamed protein product [Mytilus coruscus]